MARFRKRPVEVEALQWLVDNDVEMASFCPTAKAHRDQEILIIPTLEGDHVANKGDWIIQGVAGEFYPCKPDIFERTYEPV